MRRHLLKLSRSASGFKSRAFADEESRHKTLKAGFQCTHFLEILLAAAANKLNKNRQSAFLEA